MKKILVLLACLSLVLCGCGGKTLTVKTNMTYNMTVSFDATIVKDVERAYDEEEDEYYFYYKNSTIYFDDIITTFPYRKLQDSNPVKIGSYDGIGYFERDLYEDSEENDYFFRAPIVARANGDEVTIWVVFFGDKEDVETFAEHTKISFKGLIA